MKKKKSITGYPAGIYDRSDFSTLALNTDNSKEYFIGSDPSSPESSNTSLANQRAKQKYLQPLDNTADFSKFRTAKKQGEIDLRKNESIRQNQQYIDLVNRGIFKNPGDNSANNPGVNISKKTIKGKKIRIVKKKLVNPTDNSL